MCPNFYPTRFPIKISALVFGEVPNQILCLVCPKYHSSIMSCSCLPMPWLSNFGCKNNAQILLSLKSAIEKPTILLSISHTQPFPRVVKNSSQSSSVTRFGSDKVFSVTEFLTTCICFMSFITASLIFIFIQTKFIGELGCCCPTGFIRFQKVWFYYIFPIL